MPMIMMCDNRMKVSKGKNVPLRELSMSMKNIEDEEQNMEQIERTMPKKYYYSLKLREGCRPFISRERPVPLALRDDVSNQIWDFVDKGVQEKRDKQIE